jgi:hypothetical protein
MPIGSVTLTGVNGTPVNLVRWGTNGLAFNTLPQGGATIPIPGQVYILQTALVSNAAPIPTGFQFETAATTVTEGTPTLAVKILRTGDVSGTVSVNYATSDGTAKQT